MDQGRFQGGMSKVLQYFEGVAQKKRGDGWVAKRGEVNISGWGWYPGRHYDGFSESELWKCQKKPYSFHYKNLSIRVRDILKFYELFFVHIVKVCSVFKKQSLCLYSSVLFQHQEIKESNGKLNFRKNQLDELIFLWATNNLKMFYFTHPTGRVLKK